MKPGIQGPGSNRPANEGLEAVSVVEPIELLRQKQDVALEECEAETLFGEADLRRLEALLATWALRRGHKVQGDTAFREHAKSLPEGR